MFAPPFNLFLLLVDLTSGEDSFEVGLGFIEVKRGLLTSGSRCEMLSKLVFETFFDHLLLEFGSILWGESIFTSFLYLCKVLFG